MQQQCTRSVASFWDMAVCMPAAESSTPLLKSEKAVQGVTAKTVIVSTAIVALDVGLDQCQLHFQFMCFHARADSSISFGECV